MTRAYSDGTSLVSSSSNLHCPVYRDGLPANHVFGSDKDEIGFECHFLPYFNPDTNANTDLIGYEYKTDSSNPDTFSI